MTSTRSAAEALDCGFLAVRHRILDIAAALDRIDRGRDADSVVDDPRMAQIRSALAILGEAESGRAERVQMLFSRSFDPQWRR